MGRGSCASTFGVRGHIDVALEQFNPAIDRYDPRSAARLFDLLWPDAAVSRAIAANLAASIRVAHAAASEPKKVPGTIDCSVSKEVG